MGLWIAAIAGGLPVGGDYGAVGWHAHEMLFGFGSAVLAGFLMTAIPNWTGKMPLAGGPLAALAGLWLAGRVAMLWAGPVAVAIDALFLPALVAVCAREIVTGGQWANLKVLGGVAILAVANIGFHAEVLLTGAPGMAARAAVAGYVLLITIIGGRIIPSFTRNWLAAAGASRFPVPFNRHDGAAIVAGLLALACWVAAPEGWPTAAAALAGAAAVFWRLSRWRGAATWRNPLLVVLHIAFGFVGLGFLAIAAAASGWLPAAGRDACADGGRHRRHDARGDDAGDARPHRAAAGGIALDGCLLRLPLRCGAGAPGRRSVREPGVARPGGRSGSSPSCCSWRNTGRCCCSTDGRAG